MSEITPNTPNPVREDAYKEQLAAKLGIDPQYIPGSPIWHSEEEIKAIAEMFSNMAGGGSSGGGVLLVNATVSGKRVNLDKTWQEINDSTLAVVKMDGIIMRFYMTEVTDESYNVVVGMPNILDGQIVFAEQTFSTTTASGYPFLIMP